MGMKTHDWNKIQHTPANIPQTPNQQFMKEFVSFLGFRNAWGVLQGCVGVFLEMIEKMNKREKERT